MEQTHIGLRIPEPVAEALRARAKAEDRTVSAVVRRAIDRDLRRRDARIGDNGDARQFEGAR